MGSGSFQVDTVEQVGMCKEWIESVVTKVETETIHDYSDFCLSWMSSVSRIIAISKAKQMELERHKTIQCAKILNNNISSMTDLKYRVIDMLCLTDALYQQYVTLSEKITELLCLSENLWVVLELAVRTIYKLIESKKREEMLPGIQKVT
jgi:hypothetical protein